MIKCGECGYENMDGLDYCDGCGAKLRWPPLQLLPPRPLKQLPPRPPLKVATRARRLRPEPRLAAAEAPKSEAPTGEIKPEAAPESARARWRRPQARRSRRSCRWFAVDARARNSRSKSGNNLVGRWDPETGSFPEVDLDADDPEAKISRKHALVRIEGGKITIEDIGSLNGTYVNRQPRLSPGSPVELKSGDEVIIGKTFLKLVVETIS